MLRNGQIYFKIHRKIFKVCLTIFNIIHERVNEVLEAQMNGVFKEVIRITFRHFTFLHSVENLMPIVNAHYLTPFLRQKSSAVKPTKSNICLFFHLEIRDAQYWT